MLARRGDGEDEGEKQGVWVCKAMMCSKDRVEARRSSRKDEPGSDC